MIEKGEPKADNAKVEQMTPVGVLGVLRQLVMSRHDANRRQVGQDGSSKDNEDVLRDEPPWRVAGPEESRLSASN